MNNIMVCVTRQKTCQRLIDYGSRQRKDENDQLFVIHVARENGGVLGSSKEGEALEFLYEKSKEAGASLTVEKSDDVLGTLMKIVEENDITEVIAGASGQREALTGFLDEFDQSLAGRAKLTILPAVS